ncbi:ABC transporter substrate-binding protein [Paenibacillus ginsengihumi]|uniref:ABC transporter substrate-binding protein n=1 Tax=Paenibacillus ginsengihumi TaxID=431596 RepID=UPI0003716D4B|nr:ABC transporter substrate-binding protein [Paenibacillus ginsengihumi]
MKKFSGTTLNGLMKRSAALMLLVVLLALTACGTTPEAQPNNGAQTAPPAQNAGAGQEGAAPKSAAYPVTVTDGAGLQVTIAEEPKTIVTLIPSITETAFELGLGEKIVGVSNYCNFPEEALKKERLGGREIDVEKLLQLAPDVAFVTNHHHEKYPDVLDKIRQAGIQVVVVQSSANSFEDVYRSIRLMSAVTGTGDKAEQLIASMMKKKQEIQEKAAKIDKPKRVWIEVFSGLHTTGANTFMHEMLQTINAVNVAGDQNGWIQLTEEQVVALDPEVIITTYGKRNGQTEEEVMKRPGWSGVSAVANKQVFDVDNERVNRPGPHMMDGVEILAAAIYPEIFKQPE